MLDVENVFSRLQMLKEELAAQVDSEKRQRILSEEKLSSDQNSMRRLLATSSPKAGGASMGLPQGGYGGAQATSAGFERQNAYLPPPGSATPWRGVDGGPPGSPGATSKGDSFFSTSFQSPAMRGMQTRFGG